MSGFTLTTKVALPFERAVTATRQALADQGFGIITEIDLAATLKEKTGADLGPQVILGACRPHLALRAIQAEPSVAALLPCNVVVRALDPTCSVVEGLDPAAMTRISGNEILGVVAEDARVRIAAALHALATTTDDTQEK